jgi:hypothetical protein
MHMGLEQFQDDTAVLQGQYQMHVLLDLIQAQQSPPVVNPDSV